MQYYYNHNSIVFVIFIAGQDFAFLQWGAHIKDIFVILIAVFCHTVLN